MSKVDEGAPGQAAFSTTGDSSRQAQVWRSSEEATHTKPKAETIKSDHAGDCESMKVSTRCPAKEEHGGPGQAKPSKKELKSRHIIACKSIVKPGVKSWTTERANPRRARARSEVEESRTTLPSTE